MTPTETTCISCGQAVVDDKPKSDAKSKFRTAIKYFMLICAVLTVASLFVNVGASFVALAALTLLLGLVKSSADEMLIDREKE